MIAKERNWDPFSSRSWAGLLGLVYVPMFGAGEKAKTRGDHAILLDGAKASFAFSSGNTPEMLSQNTPLNWTWSSHVRHAAIVDRCESTLYLRQWDAPGLIRRFEVPRQEQGAIDFLEILQAVRPLQVPDVIQHVLHAFRLVREIRSCQRPLWAIRVLNGLLLAADGVRTGRIDRAAVEKAGTIGEAFRALGGRARTLAEVADLPKGIRDQDIGVLGHYFLQPDARTGLYLLPSLLFRHASSKLYQEAHLEIERSPQLSFAGMGSTIEPTGTLRRDIRFTPANLARALVQQAIAALGTLPQRLVAVDPACGSGIFLQELLRELALRQFGGCVKVIGYDISEVSACMSRFCLKNAATDLGGGKMKVEVKVEEHNSLRETWDTADLVVMNPPFIPFSALDAGQRQDVQTILGDAAKGRVDMAMAFVSKAVQSLRPGGVLACVLPGAALYGESGLPWRERLQAEGEVLMLGRFDGFRYFPTSLVETSFLLLRRRREGEKHRPSVEVVIAREGSEDAALRTLRLPGDDLRRQTQGVEVFKIKAAETSPESWRPLHQSDYECRRDLMARNLPRVGTLFEINQGVRIGDKKTFLLDKEAYESLGKERKYFRPAAGGGTVRKGQLVRSDFIFYPYGSEGLLLKTEEELRKSVPHYYTHWLAPRKKALEERAQIACWWGLTRPRTWQFTRSPHIVSAYFGGSGSFAFDPDGEYIVVNGFAWDWRSALPEHLEFGGTRLPWAYLALLNSTVFEQILSWFSVPLQGGQMRLELRFLSKIPIPDFSCEFTPPDLLQDLVDMGKSIHRGQLENVRSRLDAAVAAAYGVPLDSVIQG
jgi:SAM-dependent methyltransferase